MSEPEVDPSSGKSSGDGMRLPSGIRHVGGAKLDQAIVRNVRTCALMTGRASGSRREKPQAAPTARARVPMRSAGAEQPVGVTKAM